MKQIGIIKREHKFMVIIYDDITISETSNCRYDTFREAIPEAVVWAAAKNIPLNERIKQHDINRTN